MCCTLSFLIIFLAAFESFADSGRRFSVVIVVLAPPLFTGADASLSFLFQFPQILKIKTK